MIFLRKIAVGFFVCSTTTLSAHAQLATRVAHRFSVDSRVEHAASVFDAKEEVEDWGIVTTTQKDGFVTWYDVFGNITDRVMYRYSLYSSPAECGEYGGFPPCGPSSGFFFFNTIEQTSDFSYITTSPSPPTECDAFDNGSIPHNVCLFKINSEHNIDWMKVYYGDGIGDYPCIDQCTSGPVARQIRDSKGETAGYLLITSRYGQVLFDEKETFRGVLVYTDQLGQPLFQAQYTSGDTDLVFTDGCQVDGGFAITGVRFERDVTGCVSSASPVFLHIGFDGSVLENVDYQASLGLVFPGVMVFSVGCVATSATNVICSWSIGDYGSASSLLAMVSCNLDGSVVWSTYAPSNTGVLPPGLVSIDWQNVGLSSVVAVGGPCHESLGTGYVVCLDAVSGSVISRTSILDNSNNVSIDTLVARKDNGGPGWLIGGSVYDVGLPSVDELWGLDSLSWTGNCDSEDVPVFECLPIVATEYPIEPAYVERVNCFSPYTDTPPNSVRNLICEDD